MKNNVCTLLYLVIFLSLLGLVYAEDLPREITTFSEGIIYRYYLIKRAERTFKLLEHLMASRPHITQTPAVAGLLQRWSLFANYKYIHDETFERSIMNTLAQLGSSLCTHPPSLPPVKLNQISPTYSLISIDAIMHRFYSLRRLNKSVDKLRELDPYYLQLEPELWCEWDALKHYCAVEDGDKVHKFAQKLIQELPCSCLEHCASHDPVIDLYDAVAITTENLYEQTQKLERVRCGLKCAIVLLGVLSGAFYWQRAYIGAS